MSAVRIAEVCAGYGRTTVLTDVSTVIGSGEWLSIIGPNGSGKSTLLKAIIGVVRHSGQIRVDEHDVGALGARQRARLLGYAPQLPLLPVGLTVTDYVLLGRTPHLGPLGREGRHDLAVAAEVIDRLDLTRLADRPLATLSGGERQRAVLARALAQRAGVLLLDEPTTGLDVGHAQALLELVDELRREAGTTVISTLHDLTLAAQYADHLVLLDRGAIVEQGTPEHVLAPEVLAERYGARVAVLRAPDGSLVVTPVRGTD